MDRAAYTTAIRDLKELLSSTNEEKAFQNWFERHQPELSFLFRGYKRVLVHPQLRRGGGESLKDIPDFMGQRVDGTWEICEIKRPDAPTFIDREHRSKFYAEFETYLSQCHEYREHFADSEHKRCTTLSPDSRGSHFIRTTTFSMSSKRHVRTITKNQKASMAYQFTREFDPAVAPPAKRTSYSTSVKRTHAIAWPFT
jgi:hypothetical protein